MDTIKNTKRIIIAIICIFTLTTTTVFAAIDEMESNDSKQESQLIKMGDSVYGECNDDEDWFKFVAPLSGTAKVFLKLDDSDKGFWTRLVVYDCNEHILLNIKDEMDTDGGVTGTFGVVSGRTYYIFAYGYWNDSITYHFNLSYSIGKTTISKVKGQNKAFNVKWVKKDKASFYQVRYTPKSTYQDYAWNKSKVVTVDKKYGNKTIKNLSKKKNYYVQVRVAREIEGITYYSAWSPRKTVKTK